MSCPMREGDVVWAHQRGYPWWPAVLSTSPASPNQGLWHIGTGEKAKYHCTFLAFYRERSWLVGTAIRKFKREDGGEGRKKEYKVRLNEFKERHLEAIELGLDILDDPNNPMNHLEKKVDKLITEENNETDGLFVDDNHQKEKVNTKPVVGSVSSMVSKSPIKKTRLSEESIFVFNKSFVEEPNSFPPLPSHESFRCTACPSPDELLSSFPTFKHLRLHSLKDHLVSLEREVQASSLLPTTLTMIVCNLCADHTWWLSEEQLKLHLLDTHMEFFIKMYSQVQCRVCESVIEENSVVDHMDSDHPRDLFADACNLVMTDKVLGSHEDQNQNHSAVQDAKLFTKKHSGDEDGQVRMKMEIPSLSPEANSGSNLCKKFNFQALTEDVSHNEKIILPKTLLRLKPLNLLLDQRKTESEPISPIPNPSSKFVISLKPSELNPNQVNMSGIKKDISVKCIKEFFLENGLIVVEVYLSNGNGILTFENRQDAEAWGGKVIKVKDCSIRISIRKNPYDSFGEKVLHMNGISKNVSQDDLHDFFWNAGCTIDDITVLSNGNGNVSFRLFGDAADWVGKEIVVKDSKIRLKRPNLSVSERCQYGKMLGGSIVRRQEERRGYSEKNESWRSRSRERSCRRRSRSRENSWSNRSRSRDSNWGHRSRSRDGQKRK